MRCSLGFLRLSIPYRHFFCLLVSGMVPSTGDRNPNKTFPSSRSALIAENKEYVMMRVECSNTHGNKIVPREWGRLLRADEM